MNDFPFLTAPAVLDQVAVFTRERVWTWRDVHVASFLLADRLVGKSIVVNMCSSHIGFLVTWLAVIRCGGLQVLPASDKKTHLDNVPEVYEQTVVVFDDLNVASGWLTQYPQIVWSPQTNETYVADASLQLSSLWAQSRVCLYTSGSTGAPQPELKTITQLITGAHELGARISQELGLALDQIPCLISSVATRHMFGIEAVLMLSLVHSIAVLDRRPLLPADVSDALDLFPGGAIWIATPLHIRAIARAGYYVTSCRGVISSTMPLDTVTARRVEQILQTTVVEVYGSTETGAIATRKTSSTDNWQLLSDVKIKPDSSGFWIRSGHSELSRRLNDIVQLVTDGHFKLVGRSNDMVKVAGHRASLAGLNVIIQCTPGLEESILYMPPSGPVDQRPVLIYAGQSLGFTYIKRLLENKMASVFIPRTLIQVDSLPISENGKLILHELDQAYQAWLSHKSVDKQLDACSAAMVVA